MACVLLRSKTKLSPEGHNRLRPRAVLFACVVLALPLIPLTAASQTVFGQPPERDPLCLTPPYENAKSRSQITARALTKHIAGLARDFPTIVETLHASSPAICLDQRKAGERGYYDVNQNIIGLKAVLPFWEKLAVLLHELRHVEQFSRGYCPSTDFSMQENARATFAIEADAAAVAILIAWAMKADGNDGPWLAMTTWPHYADIPARFETVMRKTDDPSLATAAAFEQWYALPWRVETYYLASCSDYLDRLDETKLLVNDALLPDDFLDELCKMPDGSNYHCIEP